MIHLIMLITFRFVLFFYKFTNIFVRFMFFYTGTSAIAIEANYFFNSNA